MFLQCCVVGLVLVLTSSSLGAELPSYIQKCYRNDPHLNKCLMDNGNAALPRFSKGVPELGIESIDPLHFDRINTSLTGLKITLLNVTLRGLGKARITKFKYDQSKETVMIKIQHNPQLKSKYIIKGRLAVFDLEGNGDCVVNLGTTNCTVFYKHKIHMKDGVKYASLEDHTVNCHIGTGTLHFDNILGGNKAVGEAVNTFLNENFDGVMKEGADPVVQVMNIKITDILKKIYDNVPFEELLPMQPV